MTITFEQIKEAAALSNSAKDFEAALSNWADEMDNFEYVENETPEIRLKICLEKVKQNGWALQYVKDQTPEICLEAVKCCGLALQHVKNQTPEICLEAVRQNGLALQFVDLSIFKK